MRAPPGVRRRGGAIVRPFELYRRRIVRTLRCAHTLLALVLIAAPVVALSLLVTRWAAGAADPVVSAALLQAVVALAGGAFAATLAANNIVTIRGGLAELDHLRFNQVMAATVEPQEER